MNKKHPWFGRIIKATAILLTAFLTGCSTIQAGRTEFIKTHTELAPEQKDAILQGRVITGMTRDMVIATWGQPVDEITEIRDGREIKSWIFQVFIRDHVNIYGVKFTNELVNEVKLINVHKRNYDYSFPVQTRLYFLYDGHRDIHPPDK